MENHKTLQQGWQKGGYKTNNNSCRKAELNLVITISRKHFFKEKTYLTW